MYLPYVIFFKFPWPCKLAIELLDASFCSIFPPSFSHTHFHAITFLLQSIFRVPPRERYFIQIAAYNVTWYKDGIQIHSRQHQPNAISIPASKQRQAMDHRVFADKANLKITSVYKEDAGVYQCFVQFQNGSNHQATAELRLGGTQYIFKFRGPEFRGGRVLGIFWIN